MQTVMCVCVLVTLCACANVHISVERGVQERSHETCRKEFISSLGNSRRPARAPNVLAP
jgi:DNA repair ATPase RecN